MALLTGPVLPDTLPKPSVTQGQASPTPTYDPQLLQARYSALQKALQAGDTEAAQAMQEQIQQYVSQEVRPAEALRGMSKSDIMRAGIHTGLEKPLRAAESIAQNNLEDYPRLQKILGGDTSDYDTENRILNSSPQGQVGSEIGEQASIGAVGAGVGSALGASFTNAKRLRTAFKIVNPTLTAAAEGAAMGALSSTDPEEQEKRALWGGVGGAAIDKGARALRGLKGMKASPNGRMLRDAGADLSLGQSLPATSRIRQVEGAADSVAGIGPYIKGKQEAGKQGWQDVVMNRGGAPGEVVPPRSTGDIHERLDEANEGFGRQYAKALKGVPMVPAKTMRGPPLASTFQQAVQDPKVIATDDVRAGVQKFLDNELTQTPLSGTTGEAMQTMRSNIRAAANQAFKSGDHAQARLLVNAEKQVTDVINAQLPARKASKLRELDKAYSNYKSVEGAVAKSGDSPHGFTPTMLQNSIKENTPKGIYARGGGNPLRELSAAGKDVFETPPATGARLLTVGGPFNPVNWGVAAGNARSIKPLLLGETKPQRFLSGLDEALTGRISKATKDRLNRVARLMSAVGGQNGTKDNE